jgi:hypothetical protein
MNDPSPKARTSEMAGREQTTSDPQLRQALAEADAAAPRGLPSINADDLLHAARRRRTHLVQTRAAAACVSVLAIVIARTSAPPHNLDRRAGTVSARSDVRAELAHLNREAELHEQVVRGLRQAEQLAAYRAEATAQAIEPALTVQEASRSAAISLQYASMIEQESDDLERARREYQRVSARFPGTSWAALAAASLERLSSSGRQPSQL